MLFFVFVWREGEVLEGWGGRGWRRVLSGRFLCFVET